MNIPPVVTNSVAVTVIGGLSFAGSYVFSLPVATAEYLRAATVIGGIGGFYMSGSDWLQKADLLARGALVAGALLFVVGSTLFLNWYVAQPATGYGFDFLAMVAYGAAFAFIWLFLGLCGVKPVQSDPPPNP